MMRQLLLLPLLFIFSILFISESQAFIVINEFLADPPAGVAGDANQDGTVSSSQDEFIELLNTGDFWVDLSGWKINDATSQRHVFANGTNLFPNSFLVVFGGGSPNLSGVQTFTASSGGLSLNNTGDTIYLLRDDESLEDQVTYGSDGNKDQSLTLYPEGTQGGFVLHALAPGAEGKIYSPGETLDGDAQWGGAPSKVSAVPEPASLFCVGMGLLGMATRKRK